MSAGLSRCAVMFLCAGLLSGCENIGGGETVVRGSHNVVVDGSSPDVVAKLLAELVDTPAVSDSELKELLAVIRGKAASGDLEAAMVVLRLAAIQRAPKEEVPEE